MILYWTPETPLEHSWEFMTDVIVAYDGMEQRLAIRKQPKQRFKAKFFFDNLPDLRQMRADLYLNTSGDVYFPLWHEGVRLNSDIAVFGTDDAEGDFSLSDIAVGDECLIVNPEGEYQSVTVDAINDTSISFSDLFDDNFPEGSYVYPLELVYVSDRPGQDVYPITAGEVNLDLLMRRQPALGANGGVSYTTYSSKPVLTPHPILEGSTGKFNFERLFEEWETENSLFQATATPYAKVYSQKRFLVKTAQERQDWKKFFLDIAGGRETFWVPTWQSDLEVTAQPTNTTITVSAALDYKTVYWDTSAIRNLMLVYSDGTVVYRSVSSVVVNMDDTQTLTLNSSYSNGSVISVSFLELSRLASDTVSWSHRGDHSELKFQVTTVRS
jgi:hypothetical protein